MSERDYSEVKESIAELKLAVADVRSHVADVKVDQAEVRQVVLGPRGLGNGMAGEISQIKDDMRDWREESKTESRDVRKSIRNLGFTVAGSVAGVFIVQQVLGG